MDVLRRQLVEAWRRLGETENEDGIRGLMAEDDLLHANLAVSIHRRSCELCRSREVLTQAARENFTPLALRH
jgi:hypothetical protein